MTAIDLSPEEMNKLAAKKKKKEKKEKSSRDDDDEEEEADMKATATQETSDDEHDDRKDVISDTNSRATKKRQEKKKLMVHVPERDEDGIAYTKIQRRRMMKRVKRGLAPVPTPQEESERLQNEARLKREEEAELAGMLYIKEDNDNDDDNDDDNEDDVEQGNDEAMDGKAVAAIPSVASDVPMKEVKRRKRSKEVPADYVCSACKNKHEPIHWIYDCPDKVTMRGTNQISKKSKGVHDPDEKKVFVSGLSFEAKRKDVEFIFAPCGKLVQCKLITFEDTGRCKGQAYLTFESEVSAKKALAMSGTTVDNACDESANRKGKPKEVKRKELKLKVTKMLNRSATKQGSR